MFVKGDEEENVDVEARTFVPASSISTRPGTSIGAKRDLDLACAGIAPNPVFRMV